MTLPVTGAQEMLEVADPTDVAMARRRAATFGSAAGLDPLRAGELALLVTEAATNILKHAGRGGILVGGVAAGKARGVAVAAWDRGPGMDLARCVVDGVSGTDTPGTGLGAISRLATAWDAFSSAGLGTVIAASVWGDSLPAGTFDCGAVAVPHPGEDVCGDAWTGAADRDVATVILADGLGHGVPAAEAARAVCDAFRDRPDAAPGAILERAHAAARSTRGAAASVARIDRAAGTVVFAGIGNVAGWYWTETGLRPMITRHGTLGQAVPKPREETYPLPEGSPVILASDGLESRWAVDRYPGLRRRSPGTIATLLWRDFSRGRDDATAVVVAVRSAGG